MKNASKLATFAAAALGAALTLRWLSRARHSQPPQPEASAVDRLAILLTPMVIDRLKDTVPALRA